MLKFQQKFLQVYIISISKQWEVVTKGNYVMKKITLSLVICASMILGLFTSFVYAAEEEITLIACSDFQNSDGNIDASRNLLPIIDQIKKSGTETADGFFCCGDYSRGGTLEDVTVTEQGISHIQNAVGNMVNEEDMVFVQGNHDSPLYYDTGLSPSGNNDSKDGSYGVFVIHNQDYTWKNPDESRIKLTAQNLINYLNEKLNTGYDKPIFVLSHLPLHYTMRTANDGDAKYASYIFNALNSAAKKGLNIIYLYGHDHSNGWDDYMGGSSVFVKKGDKLLIAKNDKSAKAYQNLQFTYLNAGFIGYYDNHNGADDALTMTVFKINGSEVKISRYSKDGIHDLKSKGVTNAYKGETGYTPNTTVYKSPQTVALTKVSDKTPINDIIKLEYGTKRFERLDTLDHIDANGEYLLVYNSSKDYVMIPSVVTKQDSDGKRTGFDIVSTEVFGDSVAYADLSSEWLWTLKRVDGGWTLGDNEGFVKFEKTTDQKIRATLESVGDVLILDGALGEFTFSSDVCSLDYNDRELINGYEGSPAKFYIYRYVGYDITVSGGTSKMQGNEMNTAKQGQTVELSLGEIPQGKAFDKWVVTKGEIELDNASDPKATFIMTSSEIVIEATYKDALVSSVEPLKNDAPDLTKIICVVAISLVLVEALAIVLLAARKTKRSIQ